MFHSSLSSSLDQFEGSASLPDRFTSGERTQVLTDQEAGWDPELTWTVWKRERFVGLVGSETAIVGLSGLT
jgi:hypothetical protein